MGAKTGRRLWIFNHHAAGPGRHESLAGELARRGWQVRLYASSFLHNAFEEQKSYPPGRSHLVEKLRGVERVWLKTPSYRGNGPARLYNHLVFACRAVSQGSRENPPDIIIGSSAHLLAALAAFYLAGRKRIPFIFEIRDIWPLSLVEIGAMPRHSPLVLGLGALEKFLYRRAGLIISALPGGAEHVANLGIDRGKVIYLPNGTDLAWFDRCSAGEVISPEASEFFQKAGQNIVFTYAGAHGYANGLETIVEAAGILQRKGEEKIHILLVGDGPCKNDLVEAARGQGLTNITFLATQKKDQVPALLKKSGACLFHLRRSGAYRFGLSSNKLFEYMASARPVLAAVEKEAAAQFSDIFWQVPSDDPQALAGAMLKLAASPPEVKDSLGSSARDYVQRYHDLPVLADRLEEALERCLRQVY